MMKLLKWFGIGLLMMSFLPFAYANEPTGMWVTVDDKTGEKRAVVDLFISNGILNGKIVQTFPQPGDSGVCTHCPKAFKDQPILGMQFMWGLKNKGHGIWDGGRVLDAKTGKVYHVKLKVDGSKLYVRGYLGVSMLGRTQIWVRK